MTKAKKEQAAVFQPGDLIAGAAAFGTSPEMMAGALYGVTGPITKEEAQKRLEDFKTKGVR